MQCLTFTPRRVTPLVDPWVIVVTKHAVGKFGPQEHARMSSQRCAIVVHVGKHLPDLSAEKWVDRWMHGSVRHNIQMRDHHLDQVLERAPRESVAG